ncbi:biopolymer transporter ExbD [Flavihumibacter rivuli]|uniref:ExbD/TolR family protein n=1 Tax=Flavihumibacter rivuli TaxID=2838156 RepID=UPI001BDF6719|nr:biopolymer transporter ExbD [Flavihumibacter rivuli]ULQ55719.1 biopolymer transporter ExbD [Flavihumibacter rivuli]
MAEMMANAASSGKQGAITRSKKLSTRVDLTPMVDLGFLLITFFIFTTQLSKPAVLKFNLPANGSPLLTGESTTLTIIPMANDSLFYFHGELETALRQEQYGTTGFHWETGIGEIIRTKKKMLAQTGKLNDLFVIITPTPSCSYKNIVDLMDEMLINDVKKYSFSDDGALLDMIGHH